MPLTRKFIFVLIVFLAPVSALRAASISVGVISNASSATGFSYALTGSATAITSVTINAGDSVTWDSTNLTSSTHPLYLYDSTTATCMENGVSASGLVVTFPNPGTYPFHCGHHGATCNPGNTTCSSTGCTAMAAQIIVLAAGATSTPTNTATATMTSTVTNTRTLTPTSTVTNSPTFTLSSTPTG
ncbi:MAG TPA: hypothetical protein VK859_05550, partial [bacterium]|nr:hypothetical protein [bacterium]